MSTIEDHFATIRGIDARAEREAAKIRERLAYQDREFKANLWEPALHAARRVAAHIRRELRPHDVALRDEKCWRISGKDMSVHPTFAFELWPRLEGATGGYVTHARTPIKVSLSPRDAAELTYMLDALKDAADRLALMMFQSHEKEAAA